MNLKEKITNLCKMYDNQYSKPTLRKVVRLLNIILVNEETDLIRISRSIPLGIYTIKKYSEYNEFIKILLTEEEIELFRKKVDNIFEIYNEKIKDNSEEVLRNIIDDIYNTRYKLDEICIKNFLSPGRFKKILADDNYLDRCFGIGTKDKVKERLKETSVIRNKVPRDEYVIEDRYQLLIVKPEITYLNSLDFRKLTLAASYLKSGADLAYVKTKHETNLLSIIPILSSPLLKEILKEEYYAILQRCMAIENMLIGEDMIKRKEFLLNLVRDLISNNYDKTKTANQYGIPENLLDRLLKDSIKTTILDEEIKKQIASSFEAESSEDVKKK